MKYVLRSGLDRRVALLHAAHVLRAAVVGLQAREPMVFGNLSRKSNYGFAGLDAATAHADLELDIDVQVPLQLRDVLGVIDADADLCATRKRGDALELVRADHLVGDEHIGDAALHHRLGLRNLLAAHADRAGGDLALRDLGSLVRLGVRAYANAVFH